MTTKPKTRRTAASPAAVLVDQDALFEKARTAMEEQPITVLRRLPEHDDFEMEIAYRMAEAYMGHAPDLATIHSHAIQISLNWRNQITRYSNMQALQQRLLGLGFTVNAGRYYPPTTKVTP